MDQVNEYYKKIMDYIFSQYLKPKQNNIPSNTQTQPSSNAAIPDAFNFGRAGNSVSCSGVGI